MLLLPLCILNFFLIFHLTLFVPRPNFIPSSASHNGNIHNSLGLVNQSSPKVVLHRKQPIMQAIREESRHIFSLSHNDHSNSTPSEEKVLEDPQIEEKAGDSFPKEPHQNVNGSEIEEEVELNKALGDPIVSLDNPPLNVSEEERIKWFTQNLASFKILYSDSN